MPNSTVKVKYNSAQNKLQTTLGVWVDQVKVKLLLTERTLKEASKVQEDLEIGIERPGHFILEHHLHKRSTRFQFHSHADVLSKTLKLTLVHHIGPGVTTLEGSVALDRHNKTTVKHNFAKPGPLVKYEFNKDQYAVEPQFDFGAGSNSAWGLAIKKGLGKNFLKAAYFHKRHEVELEFQHMIKGGPLKIVAIADTENVKKVPRLTFEKEWKV